MPFDVVLFDVFGTLVDYEADGSRLTYPATHAMLAGWGLEHDHDEFVTSWTSASRTLEAAATTSLREYGMPDVAAHYAASCPVDLDGERQRQLVASFMDEWRLGIRPIPGVPDMIRRLAAAHRLGIVSNTHDATMVPELLDGLGILDAFDVVVLSIDHGHRKPHPSIYRATLDAVACEPSRVAFVGDTSDADYHAPAELGMTAWLIDPAGTSGVDPSRRRRSVLDIEHRLAHAT